MKYFIVLAFLLSGCNPKINADNKTVKEVVAPAPTPTPELPENPEVPEPPPVKPPEEPAEPPVKPEPPAQPRTCSLPVWWDMYHPLATHYFFQVNSSNYYREAVFPLHITRYLFQGTPGRYCFNVALMGQYGPIMQTGVFCGDCL